MCDSWPADNQYAGPDEIKFDTSKIMFHGHSHGGLTGSIAAAYVDDVIAWVISGAGGRLGITIMERENPDIISLVNDIVGAPKEELQLHHPLIALLQWMTDITDPINYAPYWIERPYSGHARNVMLTTGFLDPYTPKNTAAALTTAAHIPLLKPVSESVKGLDMLGLEVYERPTSDNVSGPDGETATAGFCQYPTAGHFPIFDDEDAVKLYQEFFRSVVFDGTAVLGYE